MSDLLLEIGSEEIPARFLPPARAALLASAHADLKNWGLGGQAQTLGTPRRTVLIVRGLADKQSDYEETVTGPSWDRAFADGKPTPAASGFAKKNGVAPEALVKISNARGKFAGFTALRMGRGADALLTEAIPRWLSGLPFGKNMRWEASGVRFARPVRWLVAMLGNNVLDLDFAGLKAGRQSRGHRFYGQHFSIESVSQYLSELERQYVLVEPQARRARIVEMARDLAAAQNLTIDWDEALLDEVCDLIEWPTPLLGSFKPTFLELPDCVLEAPMKKHQRYFPVRDSRGRIAAHFLAVSNQPGDPQGKIVAGNERVLTARLSDAKYFWEQDRQKPLLEHGQKLRRITWQEGLGSLHDLKERVKQLALNILPHFSGTSATVTDAADLYLADLGTQMVYEFGELQGQMGSIYAKLDGKSEVVATAIREAQLPARPEDALPQSGEGLVLAIAHRVDLIVGNLVAGHDVTGSQDPYGMRRAAIGIFRLFGSIETQLTPADLSKQMLAIYRQAAYLGVKVPADIEARIDRFWQARLVAYLENVAKDSAAAKAIAAACEGHIAGALARLNAVNRYFADPQARERFLDTYKRLRNIAKDTAAAEQLDNWQDGETKAFAQAIATAQELLDRQIAQASAALLKSPAAQPDAPDLLQTLAPVIAAAEKLFADVTINTDDKQLTAMRKSLVKTAQRTFDRIAVFDLYISGETS